MPPTRRQFLAAAAGSALLAPRAGAASILLAPRTGFGTADSVIFLMMTGGPSQLDTFDPKPDAPSDVRSPFAAIPTKVPGIRVTELFPKMAGIADKFALVRSVHHTDAPIHEVGFQWVNSGRFFGDGPEWPSVGTVTGHLKTRDDPRFLTCVMPSTEVNTGLHASHGQEAAHLPFPVAVLEGEGPNALLGSQRSQFGKSAFGRSDFGRYVAWAALLARVNTKHGLGAFVTVNQFSTVFDSPSWDCHAEYGGRLSCSLADYRDTVAPSFDAAFTQLITDLDGRGLLDRTLVVATGEFGRTPKFNCNGGRDHWPGVWTTIFAGGGVKGGQVVGSSDAIASEPKDRPVHASDIPATIFHALGIGPDATIPGPSGSPVPAYIGRPVVELF